MYEKCFCALETCAKFSALRQFGVSQKNNSIASSFLRSPPAQTYSILPYKTRVRRLHSRLEVPASAEIYVSSELSDFSPDVSIIVQEIHVRSWLSITRKTAASDVSCESVCSVWFAGPLNDLVIVHGQTSIQSWMVRKSRKQRLLAKRNTFLLSVPSFASSTEGKLGVDNNLITRLLRQLGLLNINISADDSSMIMFSVLT